MYKEVEVPDQTLVRRAIWVPGAELKPPEEQQVALIVGLSPQPLGFSSIGLHYVAQVGPP